MGFDHEDFGRRLAAIGEAPDIVALRAAMMGALGTMGIGAAYFLAPVGADPRLPGRLANNGLPDVWERHYRAHLYQYDPLPQIALARLKPFAWPAATDAEKLDLRQRKYLRIAAQYGLAQGIGVACFGPSARCGFLGAAWPANRAPPGQVEMLRVHTVGQLAFLRHCRLIRREDNFPPLSNRELEVLNWMAQGKSNPVIAKNLGISPSFIDIYVKRVFAKLNVADRTSASVRAVSLGLLIAPELLPSRPEERKEEE